MTTEGRALKARGEFFTPPEISQFLVDWRIRSPTDRMLEPSCGDAAFLLPAASRLAALGTRQAGNQLQGIEIHPPSVLAARNLLNERGFSATIKNADFFDETPQPTFDVVVGNPPFVRYQDFSGAAQPKA